MNWTDPRKSDKFSQQTLSACKKIQTTCLNTPIFDKDCKATKNQTHAITTNIANHKSCPYHFNYQDHVCLTCRKSICVRCAITYCQQHFIKQEKEMIPILMQDLRKIYIKQKIDEIQTKLSQSLQRQDYFQNKLSKLVQKIQKNFNAVIQSLNEKKIQIISYFDVQFQKCFQEYQEYDGLLKKKLIWLNSMDHECLKFMKQFPLQSEKFTIERIDEVTENVKNDTEVCIAQKKLLDLFLGKSNFTIDKLWSQENLQKVLYEIENIPYKFTKDLMIASVKKLQKKRRIITQLGDTNNKMISSVNKSPPVKNVKASGRMIYNKFNSGRKLKQEKLQKSECM